MKLLYTYLVFFSSLLFCTSNSFAQDWYKLTLEETVNIEEVKKAAEKHFDKVGRGKHTGYKQYNRWLNNATINMDENGVPYTRIHEEIELEKFKLNSVSRERERGALRSFTDGDGDWTPMGPFYPQGENIEAKRLGRVPVMAVEPIDQELMFVGTHGGGLWRSRDAGESWTALGDNFDNMFIAAIEIDPHNANHILYMNDGSEIFESFDEGDTWNEIMDFNQNMVNFSKMIKFHPTDPDVFFVTGRSLYKTTDGGANFEMVLDQDNEDVFFKHGDPTTIYSTGDNFWKSTDSGETWTQITNGIQFTERMKIAITEADPNRVYVIQVEDSGFGRIYKSMDSGDSFEVMADISQGVPNYLGVLAPRCMTIMCSNTDPDKLHMGGLNHFRSDDGGATIYEVPDSQNSEDPAHIHADVIVMQNINGTLYAASDGGIYRSTDNGTNYIALAGNGLMVTQFHGFGSSAPFPGTGEGSDPNLLVGGAQDNGTKISKGANFEWENWLGSDGMKCFIDYENDNIIYGEAQNGLIFRTDDAGATFLVLDRPETEGGFITPYIMDPLIPTTIYVGYTDLYRSTDSGDNWTKMTSGQSEGSTLTEIAVAPSDNNHMYFSQRERLWVSTNAQAENPTWTEIIDETVQTFINFISINPYDPLHVLLATTGSGIYESKDGGESWTDISGNLPDIKANCVLIDNSVENRIYVGMKQGVYYKDDTMETWELFGNGLPRCDVRELEVNYQANKLRAATYARGIWEIPVTNTDASCGIPIELSISELSNTNVTLSWAAVPGASSYDIRLRNSITDSWMTIPANSTSEVLTNLNTDDIAYEFQVRANCDGILSRYAPAMEFGTNTTIVYCNSKGENVDDEWIGRVQFGDIDNTSGDNGGYGDFRETHSTVVAPGSSTTITIFPTWSGEIFTEGYAVWIDFNRNGDFTDPGERVFVQDETTSTPVSGMITIPDGTPDITTIMRVSMRFNAVPEPCGSFGFGEVEDYTVQIGTATSTSDLTASENILYPNPTSNYVNLDRDFSSGMYISITNEEGKLVKQKVLTNSNRIDVRAYVPGVYFLNVDDGEKVSSYKFIKQ